MTNPTPKSGIMDIAPYVGGESGIAGQSDVLALSSNEGALGPSPKAQAAVSALAGKLAHYPDGSGAKVKAAIQRRYGYAPNRLAIGSGSDELIALLTKAYAGEGDEVLFSEHGFLMYKLSAMTVGAKPVAAPESQYRASVQTLLGHVTEATRILFLANPNNPTGTYLTGNELRELHAGLPSNVLLVVDAAYAEYADEIDDYDNGAHLVEQASNVVMLRTFSKIYGLAGLRVGWAYADSEIISVIDRVRGPFNVSALGQAAATAAMDDTDHLAACKEANATVLPWFEKQLDGLGMAYVPSVGNFVLVEANGGDAAGLDAHLKSRGIIARRMEAYGLPRHLRISLGTKAQMERVVAALAEQ